MSKYFEKQTCISGIGQSEIYKRPTVYPFKLAMDACEAAIADAGLKPSDIDGACCWPAGIVGQSLAFGAASISDMAATLGLKLNWYSAGDMAAQLSPIMNAVAAIAAGYCDHVLCWRAMGERWKPSYGSAAVEMMAERLKQPAEGLMEFTATAHAPSSAIWFACHATTHMALYGTTREQMAWIPIVQRRHAGLNPKALHREPLTMDDYMNGRMVTTPFTIYDCDVPCDGATAVIVSRLEIAKDMKQKPAIIEALGSGGYDRLDTWISRSDYPNMAMHDAGKMLWSRTDLKPKDIDTGHIYDGFTFLTMNWLEALNICGKGESGPFIEGGERISLDGELPLNSNGGQLSEGRMHGMSHLHEAVLQLRGQAGDRQVTRKAPKVAVVANGGGSLGGAALLRVD